jgi:hypothetical protein
MVTRDIFQGVDPGRLSDSRPLIVRGGRFEVAAKSSGLQEKGSAAY